MSDFPTEDETETTAVDTVEGESDADVTEALTAENAELKDRILRMAAENQNTRKRLVKEHQDAHQYRHNDILRDLAEVVDNFERAIESAAESRDFDTFYNGIVLIEKQFKGMLIDRYQLERIGIEGEEFNPSFHEALSVVEDPEAGTDTVKQVLQSGYRLHQRILRTAKVVIARSSATKKTEISEETGE
jgi:molecular chaperone GrpE